MTGRVNAAIKSIAAKSDSACIDVRAALKGPTYTYDETHYLSNDGEPPERGGARADRGSRDGRDRERTPHLALGAHSGDVLAN
jgi:hypothetical protein